MTSTPADLARYRAELRGWLATESPPAWRQRLRVATEADVVAFYRNWTRRLHAAGHLVPHWPVRFEGRGLGFTGQVVLQQELSRADAPRPRPMTVSLGHAAATLMEHGTEHQQALIGGILDGDIWCQGFSEPDAGSDLAALRTRAVADGERYLVNGRKTWSSFAGYARWCLLLARTDPAAPKHQGISCFIVDMTAPGLTVRPIRQSTGSAEFCEIVLDDVAVPAIMRVGADGDGWRIAQTTLAAERAVQMIELTESLRRALAKLVADSAALPGPAGTPRLADDGAFRAQVAEVGIDIDVLAALTERSLSDVAGTGSLGPMSSVLKVFLSELLSRFTHLAARAQGLLALLDVGEPREVGYLSDDSFTDHLRSWTWTIAAGTNEIQRNIIAERVLGLPREGRT